MTGYDTCTPEEIMCLLREGRRVYLWDAGGDHSKILGVRNHPGGGEGMDGRDLTIWFQGAITRRETPIAVSRSAQIKVVVGALAKAREELDPRTSPLMTMYGTEVHSPDGKGGTVCGIPPDKVYPMTFDASCKRCLKG